MSEKKTLEITNNLPELPGVYKYFNTEGTLIYVGKAKNLKKRVSSYFNKTLTDRKTARLVSQISNIEYTLVDNEFDALLLENSLIKQHQPRYNINLKDDKTYPYLIITKERFPKIYPTRRRIAEKGNYYGPFASIRLMRAFLELFKKVFTFRSCNLALSVENINKQKFKVCLEYHLGNCKGPCVGFQEEKEYLEEIEQARQIIKGKTGLAKQYFREKMLHFASELQFEKAQRAKERLELIENWQNSSVIVNPDMDDMDVYTLSRQEDDAYINFMAVSEGSISQTHTFEFKSKLEENDSDLVGHAIVLAREIFDSKAKTLISNVELDFEIPDVQCQVPQRGDKKKLLDLSLKNVLFFRKEKISRNIEAQSENRTERILNKMQSDLRLDRQPKRIECFDNSNIQGTNPVSAMVCFIDAAPAKKEYRHFNVKTVLGPDDFATMFEVVNRRYTRMLEEGQSLPDLILIDGGKGQLSAACDALKNLGIYGRIPIIGIAKRLEELYYPEDPYPLHLDKKSETLKVLQRARDEAHRFGITFHRSKRSKASLKTALESVPGLGNKSVDFIYRKYQSLTQIREEHREEIEKEIGKSRSNALFTFLSSGAMNSATVDASIEPEITNNV